MAGATILLGGGWALWLRAWLRRVELVALAQPWVDELGFSWLEEGWKAEVQAEGSLDGQPLRLRWRAGLFRYRVDVLQNGKWQEIPWEGGLLALRASTAGRVG